MFAHCLLAWSKGEEGVDAEAGAFTLANVLLQLRAAWTQKK